MSGECFDCGQHALDCDCALDAYEQTKNAFFMFFMDTLEEFHPDLAKKIGYFEATQFVDQWVETNFRDEDHSED